MAVIQHLISKGTVSPEAQQRKKREVELRLERREERSAGRSTDEASLSMKRDGRGWSNNGGAGNDKAFERTTEVQRGVGCKRLFSHEVKMKTVRSVGRI